MNDPIQAETPLTHQEIADRAFELWQKDGRIEGEDAKYWLQAENELNSARSSTHPAPMTSHQNGVKGPEPAPVSNRSRAQGPPSRKGRTQRP